jgi:hypothetical protein
MIACKVTKLGRSNSAQEITEEGLRQIRIIHTRICEIHQSSTHWTAERSSGDGTSTIMTLAFPWVRKRTNRQLSIHPTIVEDGLEHGHGGLLAVMVACSPKLLRCRQATRGPKPGSHGWLPHHVMMPVLPAPSFPPPDLLPGPFGESPLTHALHHNQGPVL